ncbi:hypothetical protein [Bacillus sp. OK048]|nr:hypothetical protein [Bacillus sp. OK048]
MKDEISGKIVKVVIITPMITKTHGKNRKKGHHNPNDDQIS